MESGYRAITVTQLGNGLWALARGHINPGALRVYWACFALQAVRDAAARYRRQRREKPRELRRYRVEELERLTGLRTRSVRQALVELKETGLVGFAEGDIQFAREALPGAESWLTELAGRRSPRRPIPIPRAVLRFLAGNPRLALGKVMIAYLLRGLSIAPRTGELSARGTIKSTWIAANFDLSPRAVRYAQESLRRLNWIGKDTGSTQRKLNRDGAYFVINVNCRFASAATSKEQPMNSPRTTTTMTPPAVRPTAAGPQAMGEPAPLVNRHKPGQPFAPLTAPKCQPFASPIEDKETSFRRVKDRETHSAEAAGVCVGQGKTSRPRWERIMREDLLQMSRLEELFRQATRCRCLAPSEANALNFLAAAARATLVGFDPPRLFATLVRQNLWSHITLEQEDMARSSLRRYRETHPDAFRVAEAPRQPGHPEASVVGDPPGLGTTSERHPGHPGCGHQYSTLKVGESSGR